MSGRTRRTLVGICVIVGLIAGSALDPALAVTTPLPTGTVSTSGVDYVSYSNTVNPHSPGSTDPGFGLNDAAELDTSKGDAYDSAMHLTVNGTPFRDANDSVDVRPDPALGATGQTLTASGRVAGVAVTTKIAMFGGANDQVSRISYVFTNTSRTRKRTLDAMYSTAFGSGQNTVLEAETSGDSSVRPAEDSWMVTSDDSNDDNVITDPAVTTAFGNSTAKRLNYNAADPGVVADIIQATFRFSIRPGRKVKLLFFQRLDDSISGAVFDGPTYDDLASLGAAGLLVGASGPFKNWTG